MLIPRVLTFGILTSASGAALRRIGVGKSRLEVYTSRTHFPMVSGFNLNRDELQLPRDFMGDLNIVFVAFKQKHQLTINTWIPFAQDMEATYKGVTYYELPTIDEMPMISRTFINEGMRAGIPDQTARERTITLYINTARFMQATEIPNKNEVHIFLVSREGEILWRTTGRFSAAKGQDLLQTIAASQSYE